MRYANSEEHRAQYRVKTELVVRALPFEDYQAEDFLHSIQGRILVDNQHGEPNKEAGYINATLAQFGEALDHGISTLHLGDGVTGTVAEYWESLFDVGTGYLKEKIQDEFEAVGLDVLIIDCIEVYPEFRGQGLGLSVLNRIIDVFGPSCALVVCKPWPLQFTPEFSNDPQKLKRLRAPNRTQEKAIRKLQRYWASAGFWPLDQSGIYVMGVAQRRPR